MRSKNAMIYRIRRKPVTLEEGKPVEDAVFIFSKNLFNKNFRLWVEEYWCLRVVLQKDIVNYMFPLYLFIDSQ